MWARCARKGTHVDGPSWWVARLITCGSDVNRLWFLPASADVACRKIRSSSASLSCLLSSNICLLHTILFLNFMQIELLRGPVILTEATATFLSLILSDSHHICLADVLAYRRNRGQAGSARTSLWCRYGARKRTIKRMEMRM